MQARGPSLLGLLLAVACTAPSNETSGPEPPEVPTGIEPAVAARLAQATEAVRENPASSDAWGRLGEIYDVNDLGERALACYERASVLDPGAWRWLYFRGLALRSSEPLTALELFERAAALEPDYAPLRFHSGLAHYLDGRLEAAERDFRHALASDPSLVNASIGLADVLLARGDPEAALAALQPVGVRAPAEGAVHLRLAQVYRELGRHTEAEREEGLTRTSSSRALPDGFASMADPVREEVKRRECVSAKRWLAEARHELLAGRRDVAAEMLDRALTADPESPAVLIVSARLLGEQGRLDEARKRLERAVSLDPANSEALVDLAGVRVMMGDLGGGIEALERTLANDPTFPGAKLKLAGLLHQTGRRDRAIELLQEVVRERPEDTEARELLSYVLAEEDR